MEQEEDLEEEQDTQAELAEQAHQIKAMLVVMEEMEMGGEQAAAAVVQMQLDQMVQTTLLRQAEMVAAGFQARLAEHLFLGQVVEEADLWGQRKVLEVMAEEAEGQIIQRRQIMEP